MSSGVSNNEMQDLLTLALADEKFCKELFQHNRLSLPEVGATGYESIDHERWTTDFDFSERTASGFTGVQGRGYSPPEIA